MPRKSKKMNLSYFINFFNIEKLRSYLVNFSVNSSISRYVLYFKLMLIVLVLIIMLINAIEVMQCCNNHGM